MRAYHPSMGTRPLLAFMAMIAVLFASALTGSAAASAATMTHDTQMTQMGHCSSPPADQHDGSKGMAKTCCIAMCMAVAVAPTAPAQLGEIHHQASYFAVPTSWHGCLAEIATPPPRLS